MHKDSILDFIKIRCYKQLVLKMAVRFVDLTAQYRTIKFEIKRALEDVLKTQHFILGEQTVLFEEEFAKFIGTKYSIGVGSGTDALFLSLLALGIGPGDEVITTPNTYIATALAISNTGAKPTFVDIDAQTFNIDPNKIEAAITKRTKAITPVHLNGQSADLDSIFKIARNHKLTVIEDACQAHGARYLPAGRQGKGKMVGSLGVAGAFSFFPSKNLGAFGDGGIVTTNSLKIADSIRKLRNYGRESKDIHVAKGYNSRLDSLQAAFLRVKLRHLKKWNKMRAIHADLYQKILADVLQITLPHKATYSTHVYHFFVIRAQNRDKLREYLQKHGIETQINYPTPIHLQKAFRDLGYKKGDFSITEKAVGEILSLPMFPELTEKQISYIAQTIKNFYLSSSACQKV